MSNPLFNLLGGTIAGGGPIRNQNGPVNPLQRLSELKGNPTEFIRNAGYSIPDGLNDPNKILNHLLQSGQIDQGRINQAQMLARRFRGM